MAFVLLDENNTVIQKQPDPFLGWNEVLNDDNEVIRRELFPEETFIEAPDDVVCGMVKSGDKYIAPKIENDQEKPKE